MNNRQHRYALTVTWTGNNGQGTSSYTAYDRSHTVQADHKIAIPGSSDPAFRGDAARYNPEELLVASLSSCHMLWYLHLCAEAGIVVTAYSDRATGTMVETADGGGHFSEVTLHPVVTVKEEGMVNIANALHQKANKLCYIANSCNFPIHHQPVCLVEAAL
jgi:organic hydroperoxide reductase OsmC/OhrA